jgi:hypothetical protein
MVSLEPTKEELLQSIERLREYAVMLERDRANLWGLNEDLRDKIKALEKGQEDLLNEMS